MARTMTRFRRAAAYFFVLASSTACSSGGGRTPDAVGVAECDDYLAKVHQCATTDARVRAMESGYRAQRDAWKQMAQSNPNVVRDNCRQALESWKASGAACGP